MYWIVSEDEQWVLSAFHQIGYTVDRNREVNFVSLYPYEKEKARRGIPTFAKWNLYFADPNGRLNLDHQGTQDVAPLPEGHDYFLLWNPLLGGFIEHLAQFQSHMAYIEDDYTPGGTAWPNSYEPPKIYNTTYFTDQEFVQIQKLDAPMFSRTAVRGWDNSSDLFKQNDGIFTPYIWKITDVSAA
jgi:hypothetical protein